MSVDGKSVTSITSITAATIVVMWGAVVVTSVPLPARQQFNEYEQFEVVSLRRVRLPCEVLVQLNSSCETAALPKASMNITASGRLEAMAQTPMDLIAMAYRDELVRTPLLADDRDWVSSQRYDLIAFTGRDRAEDDDSAVFDRGVRSMLKALLADRFKLRMRTVSQRETAVRLRRTDNTRLGPQVRVATSVCDPPETFSLAYGEGCVRLVGDTYQFRGVTMAGVAQILRRISSPSPRRYVDETGVQGRYDMDLQVSPDSPSERARLLGRVNVNRPPMAEELKSQLGLKLETSAGVSVLLAIDRIEKPRED